METREYNFDGLVGPTHNYGGLSLGNTASFEHGGQVSNPREAALQGLEKMRFVFALGVGQAVLPPQPRPSLRTLRQLGFSGRDEEVLARAARDAEHLVRLCSSASSMWTANAGTCAPSADTRDRRVHITIANLQAMFHRAIESGTTYQIFRSIFSDEKRFAIHEPLPGGGQFADEGAANHTRLVAAGRPAVHLFGWGRSVYREVETPRRYPARQTLEASEAVARLHELTSAACLFPKQHSAGIDAGAFHTDVLAVGNSAFLMLHELAFADAEGLLGALREKLGPGFSYVVATEKELPAAHAVSAYPFNSQIITVRSGEMVIVAPVESRESPTAKAFLERVLQEDNPIRAVHYLDVRQSMRNGGGPACLRMRIWLTDEERSAVGPDVFFTPELHEVLAGWVRRHYRDKLDAKDLADPHLASEGMTALDELTRILRLGAVYDFQR